jgi:very-short-patch-repair endonuclease
MEKKDFHPVPARILDAARKLRKGMTDVEHLLWFCLRRNQLAGFGFRRQHPFGKFVLKRFPLPDPPPPGEGMFG